MYLFTILGALGSMKIVSLVVGVIGLIFASISPFVIVWIGKRLCLIIGAFGLSISMFILSFALLNG